MGKQRRQYRRLSETERASVWASWRAGQTPIAIGARLGHAASSVRQLLLQHGGIAPRLRTRSRRALSLSEREEISRGLAGDESVRTIARRLGRAPSTVSREIRRHGGTHQYRALEADATAWRWATRPKPCRLAAQPRLRAVVAAKLRAEWSPQQIAAWLVSAYPDDATMRASHETIYRTLYVQTRGALKHQLTAHLRRRRALRRSRGATPRGQGRGELVDMVSISERPPTVADRAIPGHWEGDLLLGRNMSQIATLVERHSRYVLLVRLPARDTTTVVRALVRRVKGLPGSLKHSLTWTEAKRWRITGNSPWPRTCRCTFAIRRVPGSGARTKTRMGYSANIFRRAWTSVTSPNGNSTPSQENSIRVLGRHLVGKPRPWFSLPLLRRPVEASHENSRILPPPRRSGQSMTRQKFGFGPKWSGPRP